MITYINSNIYKSNAFINVCDIQPHPPALWGGLSHSHSHDFNRKKSTNFLQISNGKMTKSKCFRKFKKSCFCKLFSLTLYWMVTLSDLSSFQSHEFRASFSLSVGEFESVLSIYIIAGAV